MTEMVWEEPTPPSGNRRGRGSKVFTDEVQQTLKDHPGKWALLISEASSSAVSNAQSWAKRRQGFKVTSRTVAERRDSETPYKVYACFDPEALDSTESDTPETAADNSDD